MNTRTIAFFLACLFSAGSATEVFSQTSRVITGCCSDGVTTFREVYEYDFVEIKPEFPGGGQSMLSFVNDHRHYPSEAYESGIEGRVTCSFVVNIDGSVSNVCVIKGVEQSLNEEAVRILSQMPVWIPGKIDGHCVPVRVIYAVPFRK